MNCTGKAGAYALAVGLIFVAGMGTGWMLWRPKPRVVETYAPEIRQKDRSLVLERKPQSDAKPAHQIPAGGKVERIVQVTVQPTATQTVEPATPGSGQPNALEWMQPKPCPPVRVDLSLVRMPDQMRRVIASSPDGDVVGGMDIPVEPVRAPYKFKWAASVLRAHEPTTGRQHWGGLVQRDFGPVTLGVGAFQGHIFATAGVRF